jgi:hypothetical protein
MLRNVAAWASWSTYESVGLNTSLELILVSSTERNTDVLFGLGVFFLAPEAKLCFLTEHRWRCSFVSDKD